LKITGFESMPEKASNIFQVASDITERLVHLPRDQQARVLEWVSQCLNLSPALPASSVPGRSKASPPTRPRRSRATGESGVEGVDAADMRTFVESRRPTSDVQYAVVIAHYFRHHVPAHQRRETVTARMIGHSTSLTRWKSISNPGTTLHQATTHHYLDRVDRGQFAITAAGEQLVTKELAVVPKTPTRSGKNTSRQSRRKRVRR